jgi:putative ABC transport system ATP-binding protein
MIDLRNVQKVYAQGEKKVAAVCGINFYINKGDFLSLMGPSGCGKSSLLHIIGGIDPPTAGEVRIGDQNLYSQSDRERTLFRRRNIGFVFQGFNLIPTLTVEENITLPLLIDNRKKHCVSERLEALLKLTGLDACRERYPGQLSGGEMQRTAIARAFIGDPFIILLDEPTGNLDSKNGREVLELIRNAHMRFKATILIITHDPLIAMSAKKIIFMKDGRFIDTMECRADGLFCVETVIRRAAGE